MEEMLRARYKERAGIFHVLSGCTSLPESACVFQSRNNLNPVLWGIYGSFIVKSCSIGMID